MKTLKLGELVRIKSRVYKLVKKKPYRYYSFKSVKVKR
jgi:hypothetical protein